MYTPEELEGKPVRIIAIYREDAYANSDYVKVGITGILTDVRVSPIDPKYVSGELYSGDSKYIFYAIQVELIPQDIVVKITETEEYLAERTVTRVKTLKVPELTKMIHSVCTGESVRCNCYGIRCEECLFESDNFKAFVASHH